MTSTKEAQECPHVYETQTFAPVDKPKFWMTWKVCVECGRLVLKLTKVPLNEEIKEFVIYEP